MEALFRRLHKRATWRTRERARTGGGRPLWTVLNLVLRAVKRSACQARERFS